MIAQLSGKVISRSGETLVVDVGGVGYEVMATSFLAAEVEEGINTKIFVYTDVREDSISLYGFKDYLEKQVFLLLTRVNGIGAKSASQIVSKIDKLELLRLIGAGDLHKLQSVKGIGKKTAERILVELRDQVLKKFLENSQSFEIEKSDFEPYEDAIRGLQALGFTRPQAQEAVNKVRTGPGAGQPIKDSGEIIKEALRFV